MERTADGSVDPAQIKLGGEAEGEEEEVFGKAQAVFFGVDVSWKKKMSDLAMNTSVAESWESSFPSWDISGRKVHLRSHPLRYRVSLDDGSARFMLDGPTAWDMALEHIQWFVGNLREHERKTVQVRATAQHLVPVSDEFDDLLTGLADTLFNAKFYSELGDPVDVAYLVDVERDGALHQIAVGPLRAHEVSHRVGAQIIDHVPERSIFVEVIGHYVDNDNEESGSDLAARLQDLREFGRSLSEGLAP